MSSMYNNNNFHRDGLPRYGRNTGLFAAFTSALMEGFCCQNMDAILTESTDALPPSRSSMYTNGCFVNITEEDDELVDNDHHPCRTPRGSGGGCMVIPACPTDRGSPLSSTRCDDDRGLGIIECDGGGRSNIPHNVTRERRPLSVVMKESVSEDFDHGVLMEQQSQASSSWIGGGGETVVTANSGNTYGTAPVSAVPARIHEHDTRSPLLHHSPHTTTQYDQHLPSQRQKQQHLEPRRYSSPLQDCYYYARDDERSDNPSVSSARPATRHHRQQQRRHRHTGAHMPLQQQTAQSSPHKLSPTQIASPPQRERAPSSTSFTSDSSRNNPKVARRAPTQSFFFLTSPGPTTLDTVGSNTATTTATTPSSTVFEFAADDDIVADPDRRRRRLMEEKLRLSRESSFATCSTQSSLLDEDDDDDEDDSQEGRHYAGSLAQALLEKSPHLELFLDDQPPVTTDNQQQTTNSDTTRRQFPRIQARRQRYPVSSQSQNTNQYYSS